MSFSTGELKSRGSDIGGAMFQTFGLSASEWRLRFDTSGVAALQENGDGLHSRWREDYKAGGIDLWTFQSKIGLQPLEEYRGRFFGDKRASDAVKYDPAQPRDWHGRWGFGGGFHAPDDGGANIGGAAPSSSGEGAFDSLHQWSGGDLPEKESAEYQAGKARAFRHLLRYTRPGSLECVTLILKKSGGVKEPKTGEHDKVEIMLPAHDILALIHTHDFEGAHSGWDWAQFFTSQNTEQTHVLTANKTYSLHKPPGWKAEDHGFETITRNDSEDEAQRKKNVVMGAFIRSQPSNIGSLGVGEPGWEARLSELACQKMAEQYGIVFRIGKRQ